MLDTEITEETLMTTDSRQSAPHGSKGQALSEALSP